MMSVLAGRRIKSLIRNTHQTAWKDYQLKHASIDGQLLGAITLKGFSTQNNCIYVCSNVCEYSVCIKTAYKLLAEYDSCQKQCQSSMSAVYLHNFIGVAFNNFLHYFAVSRTFTLYCKYAEPTGKAIEPTLQLKEGQNKKLD